MKRIVQRHAHLEGARDVFVVEALAKELNPEWVRDVLRECDRESIRERLLPATGCIPENGHLL